MKLIALLLLSLFVASFAVTSVVSAWTTCSVSSTTVTGLCVPQSLYDGEFIDPVVFNLYQAVTTNLTITFTEAAGRVVMTPSTITLAAGATSFSSRIDVNYLTSDTRVTFKPNFVVAFTGGDRASGLFPSSFAFDLTIRPKIFCQLFAPQYVFYPGTQNFGIFNLSCDKSQDSVVTFVPPNFSANGISFSPSTGPVIGAGEFWTGFNISAVAGSLPVGTYALILTATGPNATRYRQVDTHSIRVRPPGRITPPPSFAWVAFRDTEEFHVDLTLIPRLEVYLRIDAFYAADGSNASGVVAIRPSNVVLYNKTTRGSFRVYSEMVGDFFLNFSVSGVEAANFQNPLFAQGVKFTINSPRDGFAFNKRATVGYLPRIQGCRVGVGRKSYKINGQDPVDESVCAQFPIHKNLSASNFNCSRWVTPERCQGVVQEQGVPCAWLSLNQTCVAVPELLNNISQVVFGSSVTGFLDLNGNVYTIGRDLYGQLGVYRAPENKLTAVKIPEAIKVLAAGANHFLALGGSGTVYSWGSNFRGQLGLNSGEPSMPTPQVITFPRTENISCISAGPQHSAAISTVGRAYVWGSNDAGQVAQNQNSYTTTTPVAEVRRPYLVAKERLGDSSAVAVNCGETHTEIATAFSAFTFGGNSHGQLGRNGVDDYQPSKPVLWEAGQPVGSSPTYPSFLLGKDCP